MVQSPQFIHWFDDLDNDDVALVGGKNASLGELYRELSREGINVPNGFAVSAQAYRYILDQSGSWDQLQKALAGLNPDDTGDLARRAQVCRDIVYAAGIPDDLAIAIRHAYGQLKDQYRPDLTVAVRSSATAEDLPTASFAGQHDTYLNICGDDVLLAACRRCFASLFTDRAIRYRIDRGFDHLKVYLSVGVMKMVRSDLAASGVIFTLDTESGFRDVVFITGAYGLGENVVQGTVGPDEFYVHKNTFKQGFRSVVRRRLGEKAVKMVYGSAEDDVPTKNIPTPETDRLRYCISDDEVFTLADCAIKIEDHYSARAGHEVPMDIEWAKDSTDGCLYIVQARPETVVSQKRSDILTEYRIKGSGDIKVLGRAVGANIAAGTVRVIQDVSELPALRPGEVLVANITAPDWGTVMRRAAAIVTNRGGRTCHAAIVARELGIPAVVGATDATERLRNGDTVTVSCAEGETGRVYEGKISYEVTETDLSHLQRPVTKIMVTLGNPQLAFKTAMIPNDGVGLARLEFIVSEYIKAHPMALLHPEKVSDPDVRAELQALTSGYKTPADFFIERLSEGVGTIAAAFYPKPVVVRLSDFKSNEYANLLGGMDFEPSEANPMLGFRGASRYDHPAYAEGFALECRAMKRVRDKMGLTNLKIMIPFCRRIPEAEKVIAAMVRHGLKRGEDGLEIYVMCEIPNNVVLIDEFSKHFDGFSIGSNDLTQLTLGVDRDSEIVAFDFDERDPGVKEMLRLAVEGAKRNGRHSGICGQAPSDYPEIAEYLVRLGVDSMSLSPDSLLRTTQHVLELEKVLGRRVG